MTDLHLPSSKSTIMVVDDKPKLVNIVCVMLEKKEFNVRRAYSGLEFLAGLEE